LEMKILDSCDVGEGLTSLGVELCVVQVLQDVFDGLGSTIPV
jgi:hypothetical protein